MNANDFNRVEIEGQTYRTGCVPLSLHEQEGLKAVPLYEDNKPVWTLAEIVDAIKNKPHPMRQVFGRNWIGNQGQFGSCNGYAGAKAMERQRHLRRQKRVKLSGEGLYSMMNGNRDNGSQLVHGMQLLLNRGCPPESLVGFGRIYQSQIDPRAYQEGENYKGVELYRVESELALATGLLCGYMGVVAVHVGNGWLSMDSDGVIPAQPGPGNHAVGVQDVEYKGRLLFDHFGSWGADKHKDGCAYITWNGHLAETNRYHGFYLIRSAVDASNEDNPPMPQG